MEKIRKAVVTIGINYLEVSFMYCNLTFILSEQQGVAMKMS